MSAKSGPAKFPAAPAWSAQLTSVGVTGTNGKTSTTSFLAAILEEYAAPVPRTTTLGLFLGEQEQTDLDKTYVGFLKLMQRGLERGAKFAALEVTSEVLGRGFAQAWPFTVGVFTNLS